MTSAGGASAQGSAVAARAWCRRRRTGCPRSDITSLVRAATSPGPSRSSRRQEVASAGSPPSSTPQPCFRSSACPLGLSGSAVAPSNWVSRVGHDEEEIEMRKIVAALMMSLDGVVEAPENWTVPYFTDEVWQVTSKGMAASDTLLLGRRTYEVFAAYWPDKTADDSPYADYLNNAPKFVVSTTLKSVTWRNSKLITEDIVGQVTKLKQQPGKNITILGSATLVRSLLRQGLLDQLGLLVYPIVVGTGKRLFEDWTAQAPLKLAESQVLSNGVLFLTYEPQEGR